MSVTAVGASFAAMVGIEGYMKTKGRWKGMQEKFKGMVVGSGKKEAKGGSEGAAKDGLNEKNVKDGIFGTK